MDYLKRTKRQFFISLSLGLLTSNALVIAAWIVIRNHIILTNSGYSLILGGIAIIVSTLIALFLSNHLISPLDSLWKLILHIAPHGENVPAPIIDTLNVGRELVAALAQQIYQMGSSTSDKTPVLHSTDQDFVANNIPLPLFILDSEETIIFANNVAADYVGINQTDVIGKNFYMVMDMSFPSDNTLDSWLKKVKGATATASEMWERVKINVLDNHPTRLFDLAAYYNQNNPWKKETLIVLFDHTVQYSQDDQAVSFVALSVHELRTPLTILRGYIEALQDQLEKNTDPQIHDFLLKMSATAQQLTAFVNNILNVARIDNDQLQLSLHEEKWGEILLSTVRAIDIRAKVRGIKIDTIIADDLPTVGVDRLSIYEVISNLIDNAIKYSGDAKLITIEAKVSSDGLVETTIQDHGLGISPSIMTNLFTKFYRDHKNRAQIGGTGLGLYLSKAIITAHGGNIWVRSKPGQGSTFGFSLRPYAQLADEQKSSVNNELVRGAHGWIKNHSLYRR